MTGGTVRIAAPPRVAFDYLAEPRNRPQWQTSLRAVDVLTDGPTAVGTRWVDRTRVGASPRLEITELTPPSGLGVGVWSEVGHWRGLTASLRLTFVPVAPEETEVEVTLDLAGAGLWQPVVAVLSVLAPPAVRGDLRRAARIIEGRPLAG